MTAHRLDPADDRTLPAVVIDLGDGRALAECIGSDGTTTLWLLGDDNAEHGCDCRTCAPHEGTARLPREVRERLGLVARCGAPTHAGTPCRTVVPAAGTPCAQHSKARR